MLIEDTLLNQLSMNEPAAMQALIKVYFPVLCRFAEKFLPDSSLAKDIVQETFINLWKNKKTFDSVNALKAFLFTATRNGCLNLIRTRERHEHKHLAAAGNDPLQTDAVHTEIIHAEFIALIYQVVQSMPARMQQVFYLSFEQGMTVKEISLHLGINLKLVKKRKYKALVLLRRKFGDNREALLISLALILR